MSHDVVFYQKENGEISVQDFLLDLPPKTRAKAFSEIELQRIQRPELREPYTKPIKGAKNKGLYELRVKFSSDISRIFYFTYKDNTFVLLHGFVKKSQKLPDREIEKARKYKADYERRCRHE